MWPFGRKTIAGISWSIPRDELVRRSRILVIDDERPDLIGDLEKGHFAVDYLPDVGAENMEKLDRPLTN